MFCLFIKKIQVDFSTWIFCVYSVFVLYDPHSPVLKDHNRHRRYQYDEHKYEIRQSRGFFLYFHIEGVFIAVSGGVGDHNHVSSVGCRRHIMKGYLPVIKEDLNFRISFRRPEAHGLLFGLP